MKKDPNKKKRRINDENDDDEWNRPPFFPFGFPFPFMGNRFGSFDDFEDIIRNMERMIEEFFRSFASSFNLDQESPMGPSNRPYVWGFRFTMGPDGPRIERFGDMPGAREEIDMGADDEHKGTYRVRREPLVDVIEEEEQVRVIAELPGVDKKDIDLSATDDSVRIDAKSDDRQYFKELKLPHEVEPESARARFKNGILEVIFKKRDRMDGAKPINIE